MAAIRDTPTLAVTSGIMESEIVVAHLGIMRRARASDRAKRREFIQTFDRHYANATAHCASGLARGVHVFSRGLPSEAQCFITRLVMPSRNRYESTVLAINPYYTNAAPGAD